MIIENIFNFIKKENRPKLEKKTTPYTSICLINSCYCGKDIYNMDIWAALKKYITNPPLRNAIELISNLTSSLSPLVRKKTEENEKVENHAVLKLLANTSYAVSFKEFIYQACINYLITSNNYFLLTKTAGGKALELFNINPVEITINYSNGKISNYTRTVSYSDNSASNQDQLTIVYKRKEGRFNGQAKITYEDEKGNELWHVKQYNPLNPIQGNSKITTLDDTVQGFNVAGRHNRKLMENGCSPSGLLISKSEMTSEQYRTFNDNFKNNFTGENNAGKIQVIQGDLEYKETHITPREMDWLKGRKFDEKLIYDSYGIPQPLFENDASTFNNLFTSMFRLYEHNIFPLADKLYGELTDLLLPHYPGNEDLEIYYSKENIPSLDAVKTESVLNKSKTGIYTINELRRTIGLEDVEEGDVLLNNSRSGNTSQEPVQEVEEEENEKAKRIYLEMMQKEGYSKKQIKQQIQELEKEGLL